MSRTSSRMQRGSTDHWPGYVDALSSLLLVLIFLLAVFMLAQFFLSQAITGKDEELQAFEQSIG